MKKQITAFFLFTLLGLSAKQSVGSGFNLSANVGFAFSPGNSVIFTSSSFDTEENEKGSFGEGVQLGLNAGYMFNDHFGADLGLSYLVGSERKYTDSYSSPIFGSYTTTTEINNSILRIMPGVRVSAGADKKLSPYCRFGLAIGMNTEVNFKETDFSGTIESNLSEGNSLGWYGAFGLGISLNEKMMLNTELLMINQNWGAEKGVVSYSDGTSETIYFSDEVSSSSDNTALTQYLPFGSIGLNVGLQVGF